MNDVNKKPFLSHLEELRKRLIACAIAVGVGFVISYIFSERLFRILISPLMAVMGEGERLIFTNLPEMFLTYLKTAFIAAILLVAPVIFYQLWMFIAPGLYQHEKKFAVPFVIFSTILFAVKLLFAFGIVFELPVVVFFLAKMGLVTPDLLKRKRKYALLLTFVMAAILTPPDVITQLMMAGPLILLYEIGIIIARVAGRKKATEDEAVEQGVDG
jgi:sec-independent protein translocase protein TatC